ncbi:phage holin family protein [Arsukibacterium indicum]|uniref:Phage holin family protein n=1 Tax=Arsukibacterium indicum TaxID=2848612 RepID=A0ABS6MHA0_9GAMM|nr:phage holin family protein [Arsukibacterium indicum]MBV2128169.1 phage holin family protein [Arsukibacterium indicum]
MDKTTSIISYATQGTIGLGGLLSSEWIMVYVAAFFAALTFCINWWYQHRKELREEIHRQALARLDAEFRAAQNEREHEHHVARMERIRLEHVEPYSPPDDASGD